MKNLKKLIIFLFIFITGLHNKPQGCGASVASAAGPFSTKKKLCFEGCNFISFYYAVILLITVGIPFFQGT
jgi:hypothetical protein